MGVIRSSKTSSRAIGAICLVGILLLSMTAMACQDANVKSYHVTGHAVKDFEEEEESEVISVAVSKDSIDVEESE